MKKGLYAEAIAELKRAVSLSPRDSVWLAQLGEMYGMTGDMNSARQIISQLDKLSSQKYISPYHMAYVYTGLGERDRAIDYLEQAFHDHSGAVYGVKGSFLFASLHDHPRFRALMGKMNLG